MAEMISREKYKQIMSPKNKNEQQKLRLVRDMRDRKVDIIRTQPK